MNNYINKSEIIESTKPLRVVQVEARCPKCKEGTLEYTGTQLTSYPPYDEHLCNKCGHVALIRDAQYPMIRYEDGHQDSAEQQSYRETIHDVMMGRKRGQ